MVRIYRDTARHEIRDVTVSTSLRGDFADAHLRRRPEQGAADRQPEEHLLRVRQGEGHRRGRGLRARPRPALRRRRAPASPARGSRSRSTAWERISVDGREHDHSCVRSGAGGAHDRGHRRRHGGRAAGLGRLGAEGPGAAEVHRLGVPRLPRGRLHDPAARPTTGCMATSLAARWRYGRRRRRLAYDVRRRARGPAGRDVRHRALPGPAADALGDGPGGARRRTRRSRRSGSRRPTSTTSWSTCSRSAWTTPARCSSPPTAPTA